MQKDVERHLRKIRQRVARPIARVRSLRTAAEQTRASWAEQVTGFDQVPAAFKDSFKTLVGDSRTWPYTLLMPTYEGFMWRENPRLVCSLDDRIHVMESAMNKITCTSYPIQDICYVEQGAILLYAWVKISGLAGDGIPSSCTLKFNAVTDYLLAPIVERVRSATGGLADADRSVEQAKFDYLARSNFKFMSYARDSILPGEKVVQIVLQPEMRNKVFSVLGWSWSRLISTAHLSILTDRELILIRDVEQSQLSRDVRYGGARGYVPLSKITSVSLTKKDHDVLALSICLSGGDPIACLFSASNEREIGVFLDQLAEQRTTWSVERGEK